MPCRSSHGAYCPSALALFYLSHRERQLHGHASTVLLHLLVFVDLEMRPKHRQFERPCAVQSCHQQELLISVRPCYPLSLLGQKLPSRLVLLNLRTTVVLLASSTTLAATSSTARLCVGLSSSSSSVSRQSRSSNSWVASETSSLDPLLNGALCAF